MESPEFLYNIKKGDFSMDFLPKEKYKKILVLSFYFFIGALLVFVFFKYLLKLFLPFIVAWGVALCIRPLAEILHKRTRISKKILSIFLVVLLLLLIGAFLFFAALFIVLAY